MSEKLSASQQAMVELFQRHVKAELEGDLDTTMATMLVDVKSCAVLSLVLS